MDVNTCYLGTLGLRELALYSHLVPALAALILGIFALSRAQNKYKAVFFFGFSFSFGLWLFGDMGLWTLNNYQIVAALWGPLDYIEIVFFLLLLCFVYEDFFIGTRPRWLTFLVVAVATIPLIITLSGNAIFDFNQPQCEMGDNTFLANYKFGLEIIILIVTLCLGSYRIFNIWKDKRELVRTILVAGSIILFMGIFSSTEYIATATNIFEINLYALLSLPIFVLILTISITNYGTFKLGDATVKVLFYIFLVIAGSEFFFVTSITDLILNLLGFGVTVGFGLLLLQGSEREIRLRHEVETLAKELEITNERQEGLLHFIGHEVKGFLTKDQAAFAALSEGDMGPLPDTVTSFVKSALIQTRGSVRSVSDLLHASNQKKGTVSYAKEPFDFGALVKEMAETLRPNAEKKGLSLLLQIEEGSTNTVIGDRDKFGDHVLRNLIENAINYTQKGTVTISLEKKTGKTIFIVSDTGIGISPEDKARLFTEGGRGKDSIKINVHSTGYGLYIAKSIVEAHGGTIRAESEGIGKGSRFIVELPAL